MPKYLVAYERTDHSGHNYEDFLNTLRRLNGAAFHNVWLIESKEPIEALFAVLYDLLAREDRLAVCEMETYCSRRVNMPGEQALRVL